MWITSVALIGLLGVPVNPVVVAPAVPVVRQEGRLAADASLDVLLEALHQRGLNLVDFDADVSMSEAKADSGDEKVLAGRVLYHKPGEGNAMVRVKFETRDDKGGKGPQPYVKDIVLKGEWVTEREPAKKRETRTQVMRPGETVDLFKLGQGGQGAFPLPIGQDPEEVKKQFTVTKLDAENGVPRIKLVPVAGTKMATKFGEITVAVDPVTHFPTKIVADEKKTQTVKTTVLTNIRVNAKPGLTEGDFVLPAISGWETSENPMAG